MNLDKFQGRIARERWNSEWFRLCRKREATTLHSTNRLRLLLVPHRPGLSEPRKKGSDPFFFLFFLPLRVFFLGDANLGKYFTRLFLMRRKRKRNSATYAFEDRYTPHLPVASSLTVWNFKGMHDSSWLMTGGWAKTHVCLSFLKIRLLLTYPMNWYWDGTDAIPVYLYFSYRQKYINETNSNFQIQHETMNTSYSCPLLSTKYNSSFIWLKIIYFNKQKIVIDFLLHFGFSNSG